MHLGRHVEIDLLGRNLLDKAYLVTPDARATLAPGRTGIATLSLSLLAASPHETGTHVATASRVEVCMLRSALGVVLILTFITGCSGPDSAGAGGSAAFGGTRGIAQRDDRYVDALCLAGRPGRVRLAASGRSAAVRRLRAAGRSGHRHPMGTTASPTAEAIAAAAAVPAKDKLLWMQVMLDRAHFSPGEIDGLDGSSHKPRGGGVRAGPEHRARRRARRARFRRKPDAHDVHHHRRGRRGPVQADPRGHDEEGDPREARLHVRPRGPGGEVPRHAQAPAAAEPRQAVRPRGRDDPGAERAHEPRPRARRRRSWSTSPTPR